MAIETAHVNGRLLDGTEPATPDAVGERPRGTRSRAGNAMNRAREATLTGAVRAVVKYGNRKATMGDIAMLAGIAKATLYNHFRTRDDVYRAVVIAEVEVVAGAARAKLSDGLDEAFAEAARLVAGHQALRRVAAEDPATLAALATTAAAAGWDVARAHIGEALRVVGVEASPERVDLVARYFASLVCDPSTEEQRLLTTAMLASACASVPAPAPVGSADTST